MHGELEAVRAEGIGLDPVGARLDVLGMDGLDDLGIVDVEDVETGVERHAAGVQHGAHGTVAQERPLAQALEEGRGHLISMPPLPQWGEREMDRNLRRAFSGSP